MTVTDANGYSQWSCQQDRQYGNRMWDESLAIRDAYPVLAETERLDWIASPPPYGVLLKITRKGWESPLIAKREEIAPEINAVGLRWTLTGIAKERP